MLPHAKENGNKRMFDFVLDSENAFSLSTYKNNKVSGTIKQGKTGNGIKLRINPVSYNYLWSEKEEKGKTGNANSLNRRNTPRFQKDGNMHCNIKKTRFKRKREIQWDWRDSDCHDKCWGNSQKSSHGTEQF